MTLDNNNSSRDRILKALRANRPPFEDAPPRPSSYVPVTKVDNADLVGRFRAELERLTGKVHEPATDQEAISVVLDILGDDSAVVAWDKLPLPGLTDALTAKNIRIVVPHARGDQRVSELTNAEPVRVGITGADAGFAATGTLALVTEEGQGRIPSLLPPVHVALLQRARLFPRLEDWFSIEGRDALARSNSIALVTGPSRTGDIEMKLILGVHGPGVIHVVILP
ncbi:MAG: lactate utilization protein [Anaerolineae bacterium]|nr:lactate utilization protein [Anaerolineae bacterium]